MPRVQIITLVRTLSNRGNSIFSVMYIDPELLARNYVDHSKHLNIMKGLRNRATVENS